jgi:hypothetical protein
MEMQNMQENGQAERKKKTCASAYDVRVASVPACAPAEVRRVVGEAVAVAAETRVGRLLIDPGLLARLH